ncbi:MAG: hypothetical protein ACRYFX_29435 [Janthinobacterium lividum]
MKQLVPQRFFIEPAQRYRPWSAGTRRRSSFGWHQRLVVLAVLLASQALLLPSQGNSSLAQAPSGPGSPPARHNTLLSYSPQRPMPAVGAPRPARIR